MISASQSGKKGGFTLVKREGDAGSTDGNGAGLCDLE